MSEQNTTHACPACEAIRLGALNAGRPVPPHQNPAGWVETHAPGALHALLGGGHYVVYPDEHCYPERAWFVRAEGGGRAFGRFGSVEAAKAAAVAHALATRGDAAVGVLGAEWGAHGPTPTRCGG